MRLNVEMSDEDLAQAGYDGPDGYRAFDHDEVVAIDAGSTAVVVLKGAISNLDRARLVTVGS